MNDKKEQGEINMEENFWIDITVDISRLEDCRDTIKIILDTVAGFSILDLPLSLFCSYWHLVEVIKWLKVLNGDTDIDALYKPKMQKKDVCNIREGQWHETLRFMRGQVAPETESRSFKEKNRNPRKR